MTQSLLFVPSKSIITFYFSCDQSCEICSASIIDQSGRFLGRQQPKKLKLLWSF